MSKIPSFIPLQVLSMLALLGISQAGTSGKDDVQPIDWSRFDKAWPSTSIHSEAKESVNLFGRYYLGDWWKERGYGNTDGNLKLSPDESGVKPPARAVECLAIALGTGLYDPEVTGVSHEDAVLKARKLIRSVAKSHRANGGDWDAKSWSMTTSVSTAALAGWLLWDKLSNEERDLVEGMILRDAKLLAENGSPKPPVARKCGDKDARMEDTDADPAAWRAGLLGVAVGMYPTHSEAPNFRSAAYHYMMNSFSKPSDCTTESPRHGKPVKDWVRGFNIHENGSLGNHKHDPHPTYMGIHHYTMTGLSAIHLSGRAIPRAGLHNQDKLYQALTDVKYGGNTIYVEGSGDYRAPDGIDKDCKYKNHHMFFAAADAAAWVFGADSVSTLKGSYWLPLHLRKVLDAQRKNPSGKFGVCDTYHEGLTGYAAGRMAMALWMGVQGITLNDSAPELDVKALMPTSSPLQTHGPTRPGSQGATVLRWGSDGHPQGLLFDVRGAVQRETQEPAASMLLFRKATHTSGANEVTQGAKP